MGKDLGLQSSNERYLGEFVELWNGLIINPAIWNITGGANVALDILLGHRCCRFTPPAGTTSTIGTTLGFNVAPDIGNNLLFADQMNQADNLIKKLTIEFLMDFTTATPGTILIGLNDVNAGALGNEAIFFSLDDPGGFTINTRIGGATTPIVFALTAEYRFKIEIKRGRVDFYQGNNLIQGMSTNLPSDFMYFWVSAISGGGGSAIVDIYPVYIRYELI